jgi:hypothetical protein
MNQSLNPLQTAYFKIAARAWSDPAYRARLFTEPAAVLREEGIDLPAGMKIKAVENTSDTAYFILPAPPADGELPEEWLSKVAGGIMGVDTQIYREGRLLATK